LRRRADDSNTFPSAESLGVESATAGIDSTVSTKITEDGNSCIETGGYANSVYSGSGGDVEGVNGNNKLEALWVEFDYQLETPFYVQSSFNTKDRIEAVESLMHATLAEELLGCDDEDGTYVYNDNDGNSIAAMPRLDESMGRSNAGSGIELVAGISTSPTDIQIGNCEPKGIMNECRLMRAFIIVLMKRNNQREHSVSSEVMEGARAHVRDETVRIIKNAIDRGEYNGKFVNDIFIAGVTFVTPIPETITIEGNGYTEEATAAATKNRDDKMSTGKAYGIIFISGAAVILAAMAFLMTKAFRDGRRRGYSKRRTRSHHARKRPEDEKKTRAAWNTDRIVDVESESVDDDADIEVTLYIRSPRNASERKQATSNDKGSTSFKASLDNDSFDDNIAEMALTVRSPKNSPKGRKHPQFDPSQYKKRGKEDEGTEATEPTEATEVTAPIPQLLRGTTGCEPIYEDEMEI